MKIKTSELIGPPLDWAAAKCAIKRSVGFSIHKGKIWSNAREFSPSTDWSQGGPIIEREHIDLTHWEGHVQPWGAIHPSGPEAEGLTPLIAAMRCYVASRLGDEVKVPNEIAHQ